MLKFPRLTVFRIWRDDKRSNLEIMAIKLLI